MQFARANGVPVWAFDRLRLIPARELLEALRAAATPPPTLTEADEVAALEAEVTRRLQAARITAKSKCARVITRR